MRATPGRGAQKGSGGIRSTGQTGEKSTVPWTPVAPRSEATVEVDAGRTVVLGTPVVVVAVTAVDVTETGGVTGTGTGPKTRTWNRQWAWVSEQPNASPQLVRSALRSASPGAREVKVATTVPHPVPGILGHDAPPEEYAG